MSTWWPFIQIVIGLYLCGVGMYQYLQESNGLMTLLNIRYVKDWHVSLILGIANFALGIFFFIFFINMNI